MRAAPILAARSSTASSSSKRTRHSRPNLVLSCSLLSSSISSLSDKFSSLNAGNRALSKACTPSFSISFCSKARSTNSFLEAAKGTRMAATPSSPSSFKLKCNRLSKVTCDMSHSPSISAPSDPISPLASKRKSVNRALLVFKASRRRDRPPQPMSPSFIFRKRRCLNFPSAFANGAIASSSSSSPLPNVQSSRSRWLMAGSSVLSDSASRPSAMCFVPALMGRHPR
mmetsp:Transcript_22802/g.42385  ORF Transcript_22802/g.42385 Transcript_22802/m.42385 type:complete len:227 (-) Transcript_22802:607-1287(-)